MPLYASDVLYYFRQHLGYHEKDSLDELYDDKVRGKENYTKFAYEMDTKYSGFYDRKCNGIPWSCVFFDYCFIEAFKEDDARKVLHLPKPNKGYDINEALAYYKQVGAFGQEAKLGAQIFIAQEDGTLFEETGIVSKIFHNGVSVISGDNNHAVHELRYQYEKSNIIGFGYPGYVSNEAEAIRIHVSPVTKTWELEEIRYNEFDVSAAGSCEEQEEENNDDGGEPQTTVAYDPGEGPMTVVVKQINVDGELTIGQRLQDTKDTIKVILTDPIAWDKAIRPQLYFINEGGGDGGGDDGGDGGGGGTTELMTLQTPLIQLILEVLNPAVNELGMDLSYAGWGEGPTDMVKEITYVEWVKYTRPDKFYVILPMPGFNYNIKLDDIDAFWDVWIFHKESLGTLHGAERLYDKYQNVEIDVNDFRGARNMTELYMANSNMKGDIDGFSECESLEVLYAAYTNIEGDIKAFESTPVSVLSVFSTNISGDIASVGRISNLSRFNINSTDISGDLSGISNLTYLTMFDLSDTEVTGNLNALSPLTELREIWLDEDVWGDISCLAPLHKLTKVFLWNMKEVTGDIKVFSGMRDLEELVIKDCSIYGNMSALSGLPLRYLELQNLNITGSIDVLGPDNNLHIIHLFNLPKVEGSIDVLMKEAPPVYDPLTGEEIIKDKKQLSSVLIDNCPKIDGKMSAINGLDYLEHVSLTKTAVQGNLEDMGNVPLLSFSLHKSNIGGDVKSLRRYGLDTITLSNTKNTGNIESLASMSSIKNLGLNSNRITGDIRCINNMPNIKYVKINDTKIYGNMSSLRNKDLNIGVFFGSKMMGKEKQLEQSENRHHGERSQEWI